MRISDWSSDVCSSDLRVSVAKGRGAAGAQGGLAVAMSAALHKRGGIWFGWSGNEAEHFTGQLTMERVDGFTTATIDLEPQDVDDYYNGYANRTLWPLFHYRIRSEEHTSELQSLMRTSYAAFCLKKKNTNTQTEVSQELTSTQ